MAAVTAGLRSPPRRVTSEERCRGAYLTRPRNGDTVTIACALGVARPSGSPGVRLSDRTCASTADYTN